MVKIEIEDEVWDLYRKSSVLLGVHGHEKLVWYLNNDIFERSTDVIEYHEKQKQGGQKEVCKT